ncbi:STIV orfB116 family protein [Caldivirga sp. UBA161]|uniref:STIV orfB116 family protein n=1 Tax=Caldivirga sp. UBA161 TaxID=1915569 RepID=UPI0025C1B001|nr:DUF1874 domain-containing protein [Caldivirga sp. UBA161]
MSENVVYLLNGLGSCMLPCGGIIRLNQMSVDEAKSMVQGKKIVSYVERQDTAQALSTLLGVNVPINSGQLVANDISMGILLHINGQVNQSQLSNSDELLKLIDKGVIKLYRVLIDPYPC